MFSPDEQRKIHAKSLQQWQQEQRAAQSSIISVFYDWKGVCFATDGSSTWEVIDPMFTAAPGDVRFIKSLHISPA